MARLSVTDDLKPRLKFADPTTRLVTPQEIELGLGAEQIHVGESSHFSADVVRSELTHRLRSTGGRPSLRDIDLKPKIPMRRAQWARLKKLAKSAGLSDFKLTPAQLASVLLEKSIEELGKAVSVRSARRTSVASSTEEGMRSVVGVLLALSKRPDGKATKAVLVKLTPLERSIWGRRKQKARKSIAEILLDEGYVKLSNGDTYQITESGRTYLKNRGAG